MGRIGRTGKPENVSGINVTEESDLDKEKHPQAKLQPMKKE
jgi:hypothetical protein